MGPYEQPACNAVVDLGAGDIYCQRPPGHRGQHHAVVTAHQVYSDLLVTSDAWVTWGAR